MSKVLVIGAGGVSSVAVHKMAMNTDIFSHITLASRTKSKCDAIAESVKSRFGVDIDTAAIDADDVAATTALIQKVQPELVVNLALPYQDLSIMDACLAAGVNYLDTANYEPRDEAKFEYKWQWAYQDRFKEAGLMALLGSGFDPGVTSITSGIWQVAEMSVMPMGMALSNTSSTSPIRMPASSATASPGSR